MFINSQYSYVICRSIYITLHRLKYRIQFNACFHKNSPMILYKAIDIFNLYISINYKLLDHGAFMDRCIHKFTIYVPTTLH